MPDRQSRPDTPSSHSQRPGGWIALALLLAAVAALATFDAFRNRRQIRELTASHDEMSAALNGAQAQIRALSDGLEQMRRAAPEATGGTQRVVAEKAAISGAADQPRPSAKPSLKKANRTARKPDDPRIKQLQQQAAQQEQQIASARAELSDTREALENKLNSARNELGDSIAKTHEDLVRLEKRGERTFREFELSKSKRFERVGPVHLSLRKVSTKHQAYDLALLVDDYQLQKKNVNLYEPVWITLNDSIAPVELVVNQITRNQVRGYISEPKYKKAEVAAPAPPTTAGNVAPIPAPPSASPAEVERQD